MLCITVMSLWINNINKRCTSHNEPPMPPHPRDRSRNSSTLWKLLVATVLSVLVVVITFESALNPIAQDGVGNNRSSSERDRSADSSADDGVPYLGFAYPQLSRIRALVPSVCCQQQLSWSELTAAYGEVLGSLEQAAASSTIASSSNSSPLQHFLAEAFTLLAADPAGVLHCDEDPTLLDAWHKADAAGTPQGPATTAAATTGPILRDRRYLLAANFHNSAAVLPNFIVQTLHLALLLPRGHLAVSLYESGSSDTSRLWLTLLHQLLLPLGVPHNITTAGRLSPRLGLPRIQLLAALRNALLEPWMPQQQQQTRKQASQQHHQHHQQQRSAWFQQSSTHSRATSAPAAAGAAELSYAAAGGFVPDTLLFANDVLLCVGDMLRLAMHDAHIACGMDFYSAPWMDGKPAADDTAAAAGGGNSSRTAAGSGAAGSSIDPGDDDFFDPDSMQLQHTAGSGTATAGGAAGGLRFYDKWVARDITGRRLRNRHPFISHTPSQTQLAAGQPVAMSCCWNGLVSLAAAPFVSGLRFRSHQPGECQASECSLMCDDLSRAVWAHVVMDPGVRLAYEAAQVDALGGAAATAAAAGAGVGPHAASHGKGGSSPIGGVVLGLGPRLPWQQVAATSVRLAAEAHAREAAATGCRRQRQRQQGALATATAASSVGSGAGCGGVEPARLVECCDLQPGRSYVDFRRDCHMVDIMAVNYTAPAVAA